MTKGITTLLMIGTAPPLHRTTCSGLDVDRPSGRARSPGNLSTFPAAASLGPSAFSCILADLTVSFINRCSNSNMPRASSNKGSDNGVLTPTEPSLLIPYRTAHYRSCIDRPGGGILLTVTQIEPSAAAPVLKVGAPMSAHLGRRLLHPAIIFIYGYRDFAMSRVSRAGELYPQSCSLSNDNGILVPYLAASELFLGRQGGGILFFRTQVKHSAAAPVLKGLVS